MYSWHKIDEKRINKTTPQKKHTVHTSKKKKKEDSGCVGQHTALVVDGIGQIEAVVQQHLLSEGGRHRVAAVISLFDVGVDGQRDRVEERLASHRLLTHACRAYKRVSVMCMCMCK